MSNAADKLARTRLAIIEHVYGRKHGSDEAKRRAVGRRNVLEPWWRHHPARMGLEIVSPMLSAYAARRPVAYLGAAAVLGAVIVVTRPWRVISLTGLVVALVKSSQLSGLVMSALSAADYDRGYPPYG